MTGNPVFSQHDEPLVVDPDFGDYSRSRDELFPDVLSPAKPYVRPCGCPSAEGCECLESMSGYQLRQIAGLESLTAEMANLLAAFLREEAHLLKKYDRSQTALLRQVASDRYRQTFGARDDAD